MHLRQALAASDAEVHYVATCHKLGYNTTAVLRSYLPVLVFTGLGAIVGTTLAMLNGIVGPRRPNKAKTDPYECGLPSEVSRTFRFGISFYLVAMLFILFDIEVVFLYPVGVILKGADSVFVLAEILVFVVLLLVALAYVWRRGALDWK
jgi:NADH-quinone oxidoreductase subunit A